jgi:hypothetical protein
MAGRLRLPVSLIGTVAVTGFVFVRSGIDLAPSSIRVDTNRGKTLVALREGRAANAAVIEREGGLSIRGNNYITIPRSVRSLTSRA